MDVVYLFLFIILTSSHFCYAIEEEYFYSDLHPLPRSKREKDHKTCILPEPLSHGMSRPHAQRCNSGEAELSAACRQIPGTLVPQNWVLYHSCDSGYELSPSTRVSICRNGLWVSCIPSCVPVAGTVELEKKIYVETEFKLNWYGAFMNCLNRGHRLASVQSQKENIQILEAITNTSFKNEQFWTSGTDFNSGRLYWMSTGQPFGDFTFWHEGEPLNDGKGACIFYDQRDNSNKGTRWDDSRCTEQYYFICEYFA